MLQIRPLAIETTLDRTIIRLSGGERKEGSSIAQAPRGRFRSVEVQVARDKVKLNEECGTVIP
jgi:hypothetical protein